MSVTPISGELAEETPAASGARWARVWAIVESRLGKLTEGANPILVKETRQALKSRQFVVTFFIVLAACWIVSFAGVAVIGPQIYYAAAGPEMLMAYYTILVFPLAVIVPYSAFRSLAAEQEDNTYDLLSITTLSSRQIISGKLWSAIVQMLVYLSAVSPCIAFTFLLRGVDALTTAVLLVVAVMGSLGLSMVSLFVGASARAKHTQIVTSVALVLALFGAFAGAVGFAGEVIYESIPRDAQTWVPLGILGTIYVTTFGLLHAAAAAQISFASENRSTPVRRWMMAQQACFLGGFAGFAYAFPNEWRFAPQMATVCAILAACYWHAMGALMTAEWPHLSRRVQRSLPQTTLGRTFLSLFNPGPASGLMFAIANLSTVIVAAFAVVVVMDPTYGTPRSEDLYYALVLLWAYVVAYLGLGRLLISTLRRFMFVSLTAGFLMHVLLILAGIGIPLTIQMTSRALRNTRGYSLLHMSNPYWTVVEVLDHGNASVQASILVVVIPGFAVAMLLFNMRAVAAELRRHRVALPVRVIEEEAMLHPAPAPKSTSPWDVDDDSA